MICEATLTLVQDCMQCFLIAAPLCAMSNGWLLAMPILPSTLPDSVFYHKDDIFS
jgi:hypothetical protein